MLSRGSCAFLSGKKVVEQEQPPASNIGQQASKMSGSRKNISIKSTSFSAIYYSFEILIISNLPENDWQKRFAQRIEREH